MARRTTIKPLQEISEINMTPLIDLTFLLLITFIITMPLVEQGIPVNLPKGKSKELDQSKMHSITIDLQGQIFLDEAPLSKQQFTTEIQALGKTEPETTVMVRADEGISYGVLVEVLRILQDAQVTRMALVTTPDASAGR